MGIIAGLGRGIPGRAPGGPEMRPGPAPPSRPAGGRGGRSAGASGSALGRGAGRRPIPCVEENGLLPGRGAPGRVGRGVGCDVGATDVAGASGSSTVAGVAAAFGPGLGEGAFDTLASGSDTGAGADDSTPTRSLAGCSGEGPLSGLSVLPAPPGLSALSAGAVAAGWGAGAFLAAGLAGAAWDFSSAPNVSVNRLTTGGSTVDEADLTNSPISLSLVRTTLLSTPSSFASSWTRTLATLLLFGPGPRRGDGRTVSWCACSSESTHRVLMS